MTHFSRPYRRTFASLGAALLVGGLAAAASIALALGSQRMLDDDAIAAEEWAEGAP